MNILRNLTEADIPQLIELCHLHAQYEKCEYSREGKAEQLSSFFFGSNHDIHCVVLVDNEQIIGYASYMKQYSTWDANCYYYLDCLFVLESYRNKGLGELLMQHVRKEAIAAGVNLIQWQTPEFNEGAIRFYKRIGAISKSKERFFWECA